MKYLLRLEKSTQNTITFPENLFTKFYVRSRLVHKKANLDMFHSDEGTNMHVL